MEIWVGAWRVEADPEATRHAHDRMPAGSPESCGCRDCRNFAAARQTAYPPEALELFARLGIRPDRESEIGGALRLGESRYLYSGWFHFAGSIRDGPSAGSEVIVPPGGALGGAVVRELEYQPFAGRFAILLRPERHLVPEEFGDQAVVQFEFTTEVPWVLPEHPEG